MELILILALIVGVWVIFKFNRPERRPSDPDIPVTVSIETSYRSGRYDDDRIIDTGQIENISATRHIINRKSPFPLTIEGLSESDARVFKSKLDGEARWQRNLDHLTYLLAQNNARCLQLDELLVQLRAEVSASIDGQIATSTEWGEASEKDRADMLIEFRARSVESLTIRPSNQQALLVLLTGEPRDVTADDRLLGLFSNDVELYRFYLRNLGRSRSTIRVPADDYYRKQYEALVKLKLARRGKDIPLEDLLEGLRMKDINEFFSDRLDRRCGRKAQAVAFAVSQPDALEVLGRHISFREMFQVLEPEGIDVADIRQCYEHASAVAEIVKDTYVAGYRTLAELADARDAEYEVWEIDAEDCCPNCDKLHGKRTKRKPAKLPPYHMGCTCTLEGTYD